MNYDVIVIGSGMAGLTCSSKLAKSGKKVALFEKHYIPGGYATNFSRKGKDGNIYTFDTSLHSLSGMNKGCPTRKIFNDLGVDNIEILKLSEPLLLVNHKNETLYIPNDEHKYKEFLIKRYPDHKDGIEKLFEFMRNLVFNDEHDTSLDYMYLKDFLKKYVDNEDFIEEFCYLWIYSGNPIDELNASYNMEMISRYIIGGHSYIKGGSGQFSKILAEHIKKNNCEIFLSSEVVRINTEGNKVISITTKNGDTFTANNFVFASDPNNIFSLIDNPIKNNYVAKLEKMKKSISISQLYIGLDCPTKEVGIPCSHLYYYNGLNSDKLYEYYLKGDVEKYGFTIVAYDQLDPDLNKGRAYLNIAVLDFIKNWPERGTEEYKTKKEKIKEILLNKIYKLYPDVIDHIQVTELGTPRTMQRYTNNSEGVIYGLSQTITQGGFNRLSFKTPFENAILIGAWSFPGGGYEGAILSGSMGANKLLNYMDCKVFEDDKDKYKMLSINELMNGLIAKFNPKNAEKLHITYKFMFDEYEPIYLEVKDQNAKLIKEPVEKIDTTLKMNHETWYKITFNKISGQDALMDGLIVCEGNLRNFASIPKIFDKEL